MNIPCSCGAKETQWFGPRDGRRESMCIRCWKETQALRVLEDVELLVRVNAPMTSGSDIHCDVLRVIALLKS